MEKGPSSAFYDAKPHTWLRPVAVLAATAIFLVDALTPLDVAVAVLYVAVVMLTGLNFSRDRLITAVMGCGALTLVAFTVSHGDRYALDSIGRCLVSLAAIGITGWLSLRFQTATAVLRNQAALLELTHDAIFVRDTNDVIGSWNRGAAALYGWSEGEALGKTCQTLLATKSDQSFESIMAILHRDGHWLGELQQTRKDGAVITVVSRWSLSQDDRDHSFAVLQSDTDITDRRAAEHELQRASTRLVQATRVATLGELAASIAHEVNQPLAAAVTNGEAAIRWLRRAEPELEEAGEALSRAVAEARRAGDVVDRLRALTKKAVPQRSPVDLAELADESLKLIETELSRLRVQLTVSHEDGLPGLLADRVQLQQVIINLAMNAAQAMDRSDSMPRHLIVSTATGLPGYLVASVEDTGPGIAPVDAAHIFASFYTTRSEGLGMGLSITRSIVLAHGGSITLDPDQTRGSRFIVTLPLSGVAQ